MNRMPFSRDASLRAERGGAPALRSKTRVAAKLVLACLVLLLGSPASAQPPAESTPKRPPGEDTFVLRFMLKSLGFKPITSLDELLDRPTNKILIVLGQTEVAESLAAVGELNRFLQAGGALLLATDRHTSDELTREIGVQISGDFVSVRREDGYRGFPDCVLMMPARLTTNATRHPIVTGFAQERSVVTNKPSRLSASVHPVVAELHMPGVRYTFDRPNVTIVPDRLPFATAWTVGDKGRAVVLADHSLFIDQMMAQRDTDNITFAINIARWLAADGRKEVMLYDDGKVQDRFDVDMNIRSPGFPPIEVLVPLINQTIGEMEDRNEFNQILSEVAGGPDRILRGLLLLFTLGLLLQGGYRFLNSKFRTDLRPAKAAPAAAPVPDLERRHQAILSRGNLVESAHELVHQTFVALGTQSEKIDLI